MKKRFLILSTLLLLLIAFFTSSKSSAQTPNYTAPTAPATAPIAPAAAPIAPAAAPIAPAPAPIAPAPVQALPPPVLVPPGSPATTLISCVDKLIADPTFFPNESAEVRTYRAYINCKPPVDPQPNIGNNEYRECILNLLSDGGKCSESPCNGSEDQGGCSSSKIAGACCCSTAEGAKSIIKTASLQCFWEEVVKRNKEAEAKTHELGLPGSY